MAIFRQNFPIGKTPSRVRFEWSRKVCSLGEISHLSIRALCRYCELRNAHNNPEFTNAITYVEIFISSRRRVYAFVYLILNLYASRV